MTTEENRPQRPPHAGQRSRSLPIHDLVTELRDLLGAKLVAYLGSVNDTQTVQHWSTTGHSEPSADVAARLRVAYEVAAVLADRDRPAVVQAWFQGRNPLLDDVAPARLLREGDLEREASRVPRAAAFAAAG